MTDDHGFGFLKRKFNNFSIEVLWYDALGNLLCCAFLYSASTNCDVISSQYVIWSSSSPLWESYSASDFNFILDNICHQRIPREFSI